tara:strand:+ start:11355 stop:12071 length:717 start_codon:yes stop_codon:yes gene_type:complete
MTPVKKQSGFVLTTELIILATIMTIGSIIGFGIMRDAVVTELLDIADSIEAKQQYAFDGTKRTSATSGNSSSEGLAWSSPSLEGGTVVFNNPTPPDNGTGTDDLGNPPDDTSPPEPVFTDLAVLDNVDLLDPTNPIEKVSILDCISASTAYNINITANSDGTFTRAECENFASPPDPSTIPTDIGNIVFLDLFDTVNNIYSGKVSITDCMSRLDSAGSVSIYINRLAEDGYGYCQVNL